MEIINLTMKDFPKHTLKHCPFCGSTDIELTNTHTPSYWIQCNVCGVEKTNEINYPTDDLRGHRKSALNAIKVWNKRY